MESSQAHPSWRENENAKQQSNIHFSVTPVTLCVANRWIDEWADLFSEFCLVFSKMDSSPLPSFLEFVMLNKRLCNHCRESPSVTVSFICKPTERENGDLQCPVLSVEVCEMCLPFLYRQYSTSGIVWKEPVVNFSGNCFLCEKPTPNPKDILCEEHAQNTHKLVDE
jgi:hypothetical protein